MPDKRKRHINFGEDFAVRDNTRTRFIPERGFISDIEHENRPGDVDITDNPMGWMPIAGDVLQAGQAMMDLGNKNYRRAALNAGLLLLPNVIEKPVKQIVNGTTRLLRRAPKGTISLFDAIHAPYKGKNFILHGDEYYLDDVLRGETRAISPSLAINRIGDVNEIPDRVGFYGTHHFIGDRSWLDNSAIYRRDGMTTNVAELWDSAGSVPGDMRENIAEKMWQKEMAERGSSKLRINVDDLNTLPQSVDGYFEAKVHGLIPLETAHHALFPAPGSLSNSSFSPEMEEQIIDAYRKKGLPVTTYDGHDDKVNKLLDLLNSHPEWMFKFGGLVSRLQKHYGSNGKALEAVRKMKNGGPEGEGDVEFVGPPVPYSLVTAGDIPMPEYDIFNDASSYNRRDAHLKSLDAFIKANPTVSGLNTADFRDVLSAFAGLESSYKKDAENKSGYSGYYGLKGGSALAEDAQHRKAYEHLASLFKHSITRDDIQKGIDMGYTPAQILYKYWNQGNNATEFLQNGSAATIGNNPGLDIMGNNISAIADYYKYIPDAVMDDFHVVKSGDNFSTIQERVRKPGRHYNQAGKDLKQWNTDDVVNGKLRIGDKVWFTTPYEDGGNLFEPGGTVERRNYNGVPTTLESYKQQKRDSIVESAVERALARDIGVYPEDEAGNLLPGCIYTATDNFGKKYRVSGNQTFLLIQRNMVSL